MHVSKGVIVSQMETSTDILTLIFREYPAVPGRAPVPEADDLAEAIEVSI